MARVNIEDCWWTDPRRDALRRMGVDADGVASRAWKLAQDFWKHGRSLVPKGLFETLDGASELLRVGLAEVRESFVYVRGSSAYLDWVAERREIGRKNGAKGGKASAQARRKKFGSAIPVGASNQNSEATPNQNRSNSEPKPNPKSSEPNPSVSGSFSVSGSNTQNEESIGDAPTGLAIVGGHLAKNTAKAEQAAKANQFVAAYVKAYQTRFPASRPEDLNDGKVRGQILNWVKEYPLERACQLIQVYFQMDTKWFGTKGYDFLTFRNNLNKVAQAFDSGVDPDGGAIDWAKVNLS